MAYMCKTSTVCAVHPPGLGKMMVPAAPPPKIYLVAKNSLAALVWDKQNVQTLLRLCRMHRSSCKQQVMTHLIAMACTGTAVAQVSHDMQGRGKALVHCCNPICSLHCVGMISPCCMQRRRSQVQFSSPHSTLQLWTQYCIVGL